MRTLYSTGDVAKKIGCNRTTVYRIAKRLGIGVMHPAGARFSEKHAEKISAEFSREKKFCPRKYLSK